MQNKVRPKDHMGVLGPVLPGRYSPLQATGKGNQGVYLTEVSPDLADALFGLIGRQALELAQVTREQPNLVHPSAETADIGMWEHHIEKTIEESPAESANRIEPAAIEVVIRCNLFGLS